MGKLTPKQKALYELLKTKRGTELEQSTILGATGWNPRSWRVYCNNGLYASFLREIKPGVFLVTMRAGTTESDFRREASQSKRLDDFKHPLAQALSKRSSENFILAMEAYNRPSLMNRLDAFALLFTTAWEQILKAQIVDKDGEEAILKPAKPDHRRESIGLAECLKKVFPDARDPVRLNIESIAELRHAAAHLVMPELQPVYSKVFQAGVFNYARWYHERTGRSVVPRHNVGLLALAADSEGLEAAPLARAYGDIIADDIVAQAKTIAEQINSVNDERFAIPVEYTLRFAKKNEEADVTLVQASEAPLSAVIFTKAVDPELKYPLRTEQLRAAVASKLGKPFTSHDLQSVLYRESWKSSDNEHHRMQRNPNTSKYSLEAADTIASNVSADSDYLARARNSYNAHLKKNHAKKRKR
jgi:EC042_2821-lke REase/Protein of unknown function (DUF3644)